MPSQDLELQRRRSVAEEAALAAAAVHTRYRPTAVEYETKNGNPRDLVSIVDTEAQIAAKSVIEAAFPGEPIIGEEDGTTRQQQAEVLADHGWLIDPLDGTFNYLHGFPDFSSTIAFVEAGQPIAAATYAPIIGELFTAARGLGASLNGEPISVSPRHGLDRALVNIWLGNQDDEDAAARTQRVRRHAFSQRTFGGTAIVLAYVACGRFDVFYLAEHPRVGPWDLAAGALLVQEAGGIVERADGSPFVLPSSNMAAAADPATLAELRAVLSD